MNDEIIKIINRLKNGDITVDDAVELINSINPKVTTDTVKNDMQIKKAKKIKIYVDDKESGKRISIPKLSLNFLKGVSSFGLRMAVKYSDDFPKDLDLDEWKRMFDVLSEMGPMQVVEVDTPEAKVDIYTC